MADAYVDLALTTGLNDGSDWTNAYHTTTPVQNGLTAAGAGGRCFVKTDASATNKDTVASTRTITFGGTVTNPISLIGCKSTTTAEPPTDSDICVRGTDNLPIFEATGVGSDIALSGHAVVSGISIVSQDRFAQSGYVNLILRDCKLTWSGLFFSSAVGVFVEAHNVDFNCGGTGAHFALRAGGTVIMYGGVFSGSSPTYLVDTAPAGGRFEAYGSDLSNLGANCLDGTAATTTSVKIVNCATPSGWNLISGTPGDSYTHVEVISSSNATALGAGASVRDYAYSDAQGDIVHETTAIRTGGADDGASGGFSYKLTPNVSATLECGYGISSPFLVGWIEGDGTTSFTVTAYIANSGAADYNEDDVELILFSPDDGGTTKHDYFRAGDVINGSATAITDDATSTWGTGASNAQKLSTTITPDFEGQIYGFVKFTKRFAASPESLYVDPKLDIV